MGGTASTSSSSISPKRYDVFISFRGEDTRKNFTSHLRNALSQKSIKTYLDSEISKGGEISQALVEAIEDSAIAIVILSENYASSRWCLGELTKILQCKRDRGQIVIPVFYEVDPSDVRKQNGSHKEAFAKHELRFINIQDKLNKSKEALVEISHMAGWDSRNYRDESELIHNIINDVLQKLDRRYPSALKGLVGIDQNCKNIELLLENVPIIGIWGMGGIGKTTMAKAVFAKLSPQYESYCFLENVREETEKHGLKHVREKLVLGLLNDENLHSSILTVVDSTFVMRRLSSKKVFIVLDDVSSSNQLEYLARGCDCLGPGSKVIITTRDKHLLIGKVKKIYEAKALSYHESLKLFSYKAFHKGYPEMGYELLAERAVVYAKGIPLALIVLGLFLHSKTKEEWDSALTKLKKIPNEDIQKVLKLSYDGLNYEEREIFLDIACFLKGEVKEHVIRLLDSYGFHATIGFRTLLDRALVTTDDKVLMHDLIQEMGWEIVRQECIKEPGRRSRLWDPKEVYDVLKNNRGTDEVEGIILNVSEIRAVQLSADTFKKMTNLRFLKFYSPLYKKSCNISIPSGLESISDRLRYLHWDGYPLESLPSTFCPENLVELHMQYSHVKKLWDGAQEFMNLKRINLSGSKQLRELPDFSKAQNLESVDLSYCENLCNVHPSILSLQRLSSLNLFRCKELKSLQSECRLTSLRELNVNYCCSLKEFSLSLEEIRCLDLKLTGTETFHLSNGHLSKLRWLGLNGSRLKNLPVDELCCLRSLQVLILYRCRIDKPRLHILFDALQSLQDLHLFKCNDFTELPDNICVLSSLNKLSLDGSSVESLPASIRYLSGLKELSLSGCESFRSLQELPPSIRKLDASGCISLPELSGIMEYVHFLLKQAVCNYQRGDICYHGSRVPAWFGYNRTTEASITVELAPSYDELLGFVFCSVLHPSTSKEICQSYLECQCYLEDGNNVGCASSWGFCISSENFNSDNVFLWYDPSKCDAILSAVKESRANDQCTSSNPKLIFDFIVVTNSHLTRLIELKECGVCPIYASESHNLIRQREFKSELDLHLGMIITTTTIKAIPQHLGMIMKTKKRWYIDEQQLPMAKKLKKSSIVQFHRD